MQLNKVLQGTEPLGGVLWLRGTLGDNAVWFILFFTMGWMKQHTVHSVEVVELVKQSSISSNVIWVHNKKAKW